MILSLALLLAASQDLGDLGTFPKGSRVEVLLAGPEAPANPFDVRVEADFVGPDGTSVRIPGFYDGGRTWKVRFAPGAVGAWRVTAVSPEPRLNGPRGRFAVRPPAEGDPELLRWGPLRYAEGHVLKFAEGRSWLKADLRGDWDLLNGDPAGRPARKALLDALAAKGANAVTLVLNESGGAPPWVQGKGTRYDLARLAEWEELFSHAESRGLVLHLVLAGAGARGEIEPASYYREMIARFGHHPGLLWNVGEEADRAYSDDEQRDLASKLKAADPYRHPVTVHRKSLESDELQVWPHLGLRQFDLASVRVGEGEAALAASKLGDFGFAVWANREKSDALAHPLPVTVDRSLLVDAADASVRFKLRSQVLYPVYLSGGGLGLHVAGGREGLARLAPAVEDLRRAHRLVAALPFSEMSPANGLLSVVGGNFCFAKAGEVYAIYLAKGGEVSLDLRPAEGRFRVRWVHVREDASENGGEVTGGDWRSLGKPPYSDDVAAVVKPVR